MIAVHVASSFENRATCRAVMRTLGTSGCLIVLDWTVFEDARQLDVKRVHEQALSRADVLVVVLPAGRSSHVELGGAIFTGKPVVIYAPDKMLLKNPKDGREASYYSHVAVRVTTELTEIAGLVHWRAREMGA